MEQSHPRWQPKNFFFYHLWNILKLFYFQALYETMFRNYGILVGQVLVTKPDFYHDETRHQVLGKKLIFNVVYFTRNTQHADCSSGNRFSANLATGFEKQFLILDPPQTPFSFSFKMYLLFIHLSTDIKTESHLFIIN